MCHACCAQSCFSMLRFGSFDQEVLSNGTSITIHSKMERGEALQALFPNAPVPLLLDVLQQCNNDLDQAVDVLLELQLGEGACSPPPAHCQPIVAEARAALLQLMCAGLKQCADKTVLLLVCSCSTEEEQGLRLLRLQPAGGGRRVPSPGRG